jgi:hypothetical protein
MKKSILIILFLFETFVALGQFNYTEVTQRYFYYRHRLKRFVCVGPNAGESLVASGRNTRDSNNVLCTSPPPSLSKYYYIIGYDDQPNQLGFYIGLLATEWKLLNDQGLPVDSTTRELFYALDAINRLDMTDNGIGNTAIDGSILREDVPADFVTNHPQLNSGLNPPSIFETNKWPPMGVNTGMVGWANYVKSYANCTEPNLNTASKDHYYRLMLGLALVKNVYLLGCSISLMATQN